MQKFRLIDKTQTQWRRLGILLKLEDQLDAWEYQYQRNASMCWHKVIKHWLNGGGIPDYPNTWRGLFELLEDAKLYEVAKRLESALSSIVIPLSSPSQSCFTFSHQSQTSSASTLLMHIPRVNMLGVSLPSEIMSSCFPQGKKDDAEFDEVSVVD